MSKGAARSGLPEQLALIVVFVMATAVLLDRDWLWRWDRNFYDTTLSLLREELHDDVLIVAIDEASLSAIGRWPWSRRTHAALVSRLSEAGARVIALDIIFAEPDTQDPSADELLARSLRDSARVILPVLLEQPRAGGQLIEQLPIPELAGAAAGLGHVHVELDADGIARSAFLREGLGDPHWPSLAVAMLQVAYPDAALKLPGARSRHVESGTSRVWARDHQVLIPFVGPPGSVPRISYLQALDGTHRPAVFRDKLVLVGVTATGLGDSLPTPVSGHHQPMSGVEINANLLSALERGTVIRELSPAWRWAMSLLIACVPVLLYTRLGPRYGLVAGVLLLLSVLALSVAMLAWGRVWFAPAPVAAVVIASYPVWSWLRLEMAMRYLRREMRRIERQEASTPTASPPDIASAMHFLAQMLPLRGWVLTDATGIHLAGEGEPPAAAAPGLPPGDWRQRGESLWATIHEYGREWQIGATWSGEAPPSEPERRVMTELVRHYARPPDPATSDSIEVVQTQVTRLEAANERLRALRRVIDDSVAQMADAVLVSSNLGQVLLANQHAARYLGATSGEGLVGRPLLEVLGDVRLEDDAPWASVLREVLLKESSVALNARHREGRDLLVQVAPLAAGVGRGAGLIINAADISELKSSERRRAEMLSFLSHDLRSPLVSVLALLELAREGESVEGFKDSLDRVEQYTNSTLELAEQFVELARAESQERVRHEVVDFVAVVANAVDQVWVQAKSKSIVIDRRYEVEEAWIRGDGELLERALINLLVNAINYSTSDTRIAVEVRCEHGEAKCAIADHGPGIEPEEIPRLFRRFERMAQSGPMRVRGTGLGLAFVKVVADRHGGDVRVESVLGEGATFTLAIPMPVG